MEEVPARIIIMLEPAVAFATINLAATRRRCRRRKDR
jgi:hypothetical protein